MFVMSILVVFRFFLKNLLEEINLEYFYLFSNTEIIVFLC